jgi:hypothetical protein
VKNFLDFIGVIALGLFGGFMVAGVAEWPMWLAFPIGLVLAPILWSVRR